MNRSQEQGQQDNYSGFSSRNYHPLSYDALDTIVREALASVGLASRTGIVPQLVARGIIRACNDFEQAGGVLSPWNDSRNLQFIKGGV